MTATTTQAPPPVVLDQLVPGDVLRIEADHTATVYRAQTGGVWVFKVKLAPEVKVVAALPALRSN